jgi:hypothetical protein
VLVVGSTRDGDAAGEVMSALGGQGIDLTGRVSLGGCRGLGARRSILLSRTGEVVRRFIPFAPTAGGW